MIAKKLNPKHFVNIINKIISKYAMETKVSIKQLFRNLKLAIGNKYNNQLWSQMESALDNLEDEITAMPETDVDTQPDSYALEGCHDCGEWYGGCDTVCAICKSRDNKSEFYVKASESRFGRKLYTTVCTDQTCMETLGISNNYKEWTKDGWVLLPNKSWCTHG